MNENVLLNSFWPENFMVRI